MALRNRTVERRSQSAELDVPFRIFPAALGERWKRRLRFRIGPNILVIDISGTALGRGSGSSKGERQNKAATLGFNGAYVPMKPILKCIVYSSALAISRCASVRTADDFSLFWRYVPPVFARIDSGSKDKLLGSKNDTVERRASIAQVIAMGELLNRERSLQALMGKRKESNPLLLGSPEFSSYPRRHSEET
nr:hypothetical protein Iba_chr11bCG9360 [Ipomoea batatas]